MGTNVRLMLTQPADYQERLVKDKHFRAGDTRWGQDQYKIVGYVLDPHQPVLYKINKKLKAHEHVAYTRQQLQVVDPDEEDVPATILKNQNQEEYVVKKLIDKRTNGRRTEYLVWWKGYGKNESTWEFKSNIPAAFVQAYEEDNN